MVNTVPGRGGYDADEFDVTDVQPVLDADRFDDPLVPLVTEVAEYSTTGNKSTLVDQCGEQQTTRNGNFGVTISLRGLISLNQFRALKQADVQGFPLELSSLLYNGIMEIEDFTATREDGNEVVRLEGDDEVVPVVSFKLGLKSQQSTATDREV